MIAEDLDLCGIGFLTTVWNTEGMDIKEIYESAKTLKKTNKQKTLSSRVKTG